MRGRCVSTQLLTWAAAAIVALGYCSPSPAAFVLGKPEIDAWSDMAFPSVTGGFSTGSQVLSLTTAASNDLEIGSQFGPSNSGKHYGTGGTLGGPFSATLSVSGVVIQTDGTVTNGGTVSVIFNGGTFGSLGTDYGIVAGNALLTGSVLEVMLDATGVGTFDVLFKITGGALQNINPSLGTNFASAGAGLLRFNTRTPANGDFTTGFSLDGATLDTLGLVPEFPYTTLVFFVGMLCTGAVWKSRIAERGGVGSIQA